MKLEIDEEDLYTLKINCQGKRTVGKANEGINVEKKIIGFKRSKLKFKKERRKKRKKKLRKKQNKTKVYRTAKAYVKVVYNNKKKCD